MEEKGEREGVCACVFGNCSTLSLSLLPQQKFMRQVSEISPEWLIEVAPHYYKKQEIEEDRLKMPKQIKR